MTSLEQLMVWLDEVIPEDGPAVWVRAEGHGDELHVDLNPLLTDMLGWVAPSPCWAVGVVATGRAHRLDGPSDRFDADRECGRVQVSCLVDRQGAVVSRIGVPGQDPLYDPPESGRMIDSMRRSFELPTAPPQHRSDEFLGLLWLGEVIAEGRAGPGRLGWPEVAALHPAIRALTEDGHEWAVEHFDMVLRVAGQAWSWDRLRELAVEGCSIGDLVSPDLAAWMDVGMFSRWVLDGHRSTDDLLAEADRLVTPDTGRRLRRAMRAIGVSPERDRPTSPLG